MSKGRRIEFDNNMEEIKDILKFRDEETGNNEINLNLEGAKIGDSEDDFTLEVEDEFSKIERGAISREEVVEEITEESEEEATVFEVEEEETDWLKDSDNYETNEDNFIEIEMPMEVELDNEVIEDDELNIETAENTDAREDDNNIDLATAVGSIGIVEEIEETQEVEGSIFNDQTVENWDIISEDLENDEFNLSEPEIEFGGIEDVSNVNTKLEKAFQRQESELDVEVMDTKIVQFKQQRENENRFKENLKATGSIVYKTGIREAAVPKGYTYMKEFNTLVQYGSIPTNLIKSRQSFMQAKKDEIMKLLLEAIETDYKVIELTIQLKQNGVIAFNPKELVELRDYIKTISGSDTDIQMKNGTFKVVL